MKRKRPPIAPHIYKALSKWVTDQNKSSTALNSELIKFHAERFLAKANIHLPADLCIDLRFSKGWPKPFKKSHEIKVQSFHGEAMSADNSASRGEMGSLNPIIVNYTHVDVWNADEFGFFYGQPPSWELPTEPVCGFKTENM